MKASFLFLVVSIWQGNTLLRTLMHHRCKKISFKNQRVLDIGSGEKRAEYYKFFLSQPDDIVTTDMKQGDKGDHAVINFEVDQLPFKDSTFDTVLSFNLFEHIFEHQKLIREVHRVIRPKGTLVGFVPFLINYHPDPHDYFRYTNEALEKIFSRAGFPEVTIEEVGGGPFLVNYNNLVLSMPKIARVLFLPIYLFLDSVFLKLRPNAKKRYPLGYFFIVKK